MRVAVPRKVQMTPLLHLLLLAVMAALAAGIISTDGGRHPAASASSGPVVVATVAVGDMPYAVVVNPNTNRIYVANNNDNTVSVIEDVPSPTPTPTDTFTPTPTEVGQGTPTPTPNLSFQSNATPTDGTYVVPPVPVSYSLTVSNVGETEADSVILQVDTVDINPASFQSTHGTCTWTSGPDYHGHGIGQCDLGALAPAGGPEPSSALITLSGDVFWNFYSHGGAWIRFTSSPSGQGVGGVSWLFGTPTPTDNPTPRPTDTPTPTPTADLPDLVVTYMETTFEGGGDCGWSGTPLGTRVWVKNQGSADAGAFVVEFESSQLTVSSGLAAGQTTSVWFPVYVYEGSATATADATFLVAESDEDNNSLSQQLPFPTPPATCTPTPTSTPTVTPTATASGGSISGTVTDCQGNPLHDCEVDVVSWDGNGSSGWSLASADGSFVVTSLAPDNYRVEVRCQGYVQEYYPGVCDWQDAAPVAVLEGVNAPNVDFELSPVGDVNGDCQVSMVDPMLIAQCVAGLIDCDRLNLCAADANCGGSVSMVDAMLVAQKVAGLITDFPACGP